MNAAIRDNSGAPRYKLSSTIPLYLAGDEFVALRAIREQAADLLASRASDVLQRPIEDIVIRDILPGTDLAMNSSNNAWVSPSLTANTFTQVFSQALPVTQLLCIWGAVVISSSPTVTALKFLRGSAQTIGLYEIEACYATSLFTGVIIRPNLIWNPQDTAVCQAVSTVTQTQRFPMLGFIAEPVGINVNPPSYITGGG